ncbi:helix-turn-helix domain-containing protein [Arthrobacter antibioticus]|uniref:helix-turn-helix domain-containing protein n=1 Tax=Arthrobacter sp. H35-MC1 TaxID=3046203 RepID=UPI0024BBE286|nr:helix-turn-helix transcriptional regulator [Arthrobacter sp. H35-MC1]MDJ0317825.1 helix-turn-helix transcriptional regulator [Arthrobacter sp. H35-MC1]
MGSSFGDRLKQERLSRSLTQGELGGELYSASYISLLESARREPTTDIIRQLARQLQLTPCTVAEWAETASPEESEYLRLSLSARQSWDTRDYVGAANSAQYAANLARASKDPITWWDMTFLAANSLRQNGDYSGACEVLQSLLGHSLTRENDALSLRAHQVMAAAMLDAGSLQDSIIHATQAVEIGSGDSAEEFSAYLMALQTLVGALAESGRLDEAWTHTLTLAEAVNEETSAQIAGEIHWVIGNVAFIRQDTRAGLKHHAKASHLLSPSVDLSRWAQFNKATAWVRLTAGVVEPATLQAIERSELAHSIVGATTAENLEILLLRARWNYLNGDFPQALELLGLIEAQKTELAPHIAGDSALVLGNVLQASGRLQDALGAYRDAQDRYVRAGALDRAAVARDHAAQIATDRT